MHIRKFFAIMVVLCFVTSSAASAATIQYYTGSYWDIRGWTWTEAAVRFTAPSDASYRLDTLNMRLCGYPQGELLLDVTVWADDGGDRGDVVFELLDQDWNTGSDAWSSYDLSFADLVFAPGTSFLAGYRTEATEYAEIGIFVDDDVSPDAVMGTNIHYGFDPGPTWKLIESGELFFNVDMSLSAPTVPEPSTALLLCIGLAGLAFRSKATQLRR